MPRPCMSSCANKIRKAPNSNFEVVHSRILTGRGLHADVTSSILMLQDPPARHLEVNLRLIFLRCVDPTLFAPTT